MRARCVLQALLVLAASSLSACSLDSRGRSGPADVVYRGGVILTMTDATPRAEALAVRDGKIVAVGTRAQVEKLAGPKTQTVDLQGRALLPGFVDSHGHVYGVGLQAASANLLPPPDGEGRDIAALQRLLTAWDTGAQSPLKKHGWIVGFGYDDSQLKEKRHPSRSDLDRVSRDKPVLVIHQSGHLGAANSRALQVAGVTARTPDPTGGVFRRRAGSREPDGVMEEVAFFSVLQRLLGRFDADTHQALVRAGVDQVARYGFTTAQEGRLAGKPVLDAFVAAAQASALPVDVVAYADVLSARSLIAAPWLSRDYAGGFRVGGGKLTIDGSPQGKTAWLTRPYFVPPPGQNRKYAGYPAATREQVMDAVAWSFAQKVQLLTHANGDAASDLLLEAVRTIAKTHPDYRETRPVLVHGQVLREDQMDDIKELGVFPTLFPMHTFYWGDYYRASVLGPERSQVISPTEWARAREMMFGTHHDAPVALPDSMRVLSATVTRRTRSGYVLGPAQRVDAMTALKAMTIWPAWQHFEEKAKGSLAVGKLADLVILSADPTAVDPLQIEKIQVLETIKAGRSIYRRRD
jgi:predicted amidohydrolase YtcJ